MYYTMETPAGEFYVAARQCEINFIEIGYINSDGEHMPLAAVENKTKKFDPEIDDTCIQRIIYDLNDPDEHTSELVSSGG